MTSRAHASVALAAALAASGGPACSGAELGETADAGTDACVRQYVEPTYAPFPADAPDSGWFREVTGEASLSRLLTPQQPRDGVAAGDVDQDGDLDLLVAGPPGETRLLSNDSGLRFSDSALPIDIAVRAVAFADVDGDGDLDALAGTATAVHLFRNDAGVFVDDSAASGLERREPSAGPPLFVHVAAADLDGDGDTDLFASSLDDGPSLYLRQRADGTFEDAGAQVGLDLPGHGWTSLPIDVDGDGDLDLYVANDALVIDTGERPRPVPLGELPPGDRLYIQDNGAFVDAAAAAGIDQPRSSMGALYEDLTRDGVPDLFVANFGKSELLAGNGDGTFTEVTDWPWLMTREDAACADQGCPGPGRPRHCWLVSWAVLYRDFDLDGHPDLLVTNSHIESIPEQPVAAWRGTADGFEPVRSGVGWTSARAAVAEDLDGDGDIDLALGDQNGALRLYEGLARSR